jgi:cytochrome c5
MKKVHLNIVLGTIFTLVSVLILVLMAADETDRLARFETEQAAEQIEFGALVFETNCTACHGTHAQGVPGKAPCLRCPEFFNARLDQVGWGGTLEDYVVSVVTTGRQISTRPELYQGEGLGPPVMPTWSDQFGGPLREDQIRAVAAFIANFQEWAENPEQVPTPLVAFDPGDPASVGRAKVVEYGCTGCHAFPGLSEAVTGPNQAGLVTRAEGVPGYESAEDFIRESILDPNAVLAEGFNADVMPQNFGELISEEDLDSIIAYLLTLTEE